MRRFYEARQSRRRGWTWRAWRRMMPTVPDCREEDVTEEVIGRPRMPAVGVPQREFAGIMAQHGMLLLALAILAWPLGGLAGGLCHWDCLWYEQIATRGYGVAPRTDAADLGQAAWAFFPLYPLLLRAVMGASGLGAHAAGVAINAALFPVLVALAAAYLRQRCGGDRADRAFRIAMLMVLPTGLWFRLPYTECLYAVLLLGCVMALARGWCLGAALLAAALCLTRPTGVICVLIAGLFHGLARTPIPGGAPAARPVRLLEGTAVVAAGGTGLALYILFLDRMLGDGLAFAHVQAAWGHQWRLPVLWIWKGFTRGRWVHLAIAALLEIALIIWGFRIRWRMEAAIVLATFLLACSGSIMSIHRIVLANPFAMILLVRLACAAPPRWRRPLILLCLILDAALAENWLQGGHLLV